MLAAILSMAVLLIWSYFFTPPPPPADNANTAQNANVAVATPTAAPETAQPTQAQAITDAPDNIPNRNLTIKTPLYQATLDSRGALATSWILIKHASPRGEKVLYAEGSSAEVKKPLELIPQRALESNPREIPFRLVTGDAALDNFLNERNYQISVNEDNVELSGADSREINYVLRDEAAGLEVTKTFVFRADSYLTDLSVRVLRNGQPVPNVKLAIGASIGDQGIEHHNYYQIEPEAVAFADGEIERFAGYSMTDRKELEGRLGVGGVIDWAGIGDAYFAMLAIPAQRSGGLEFRGSKYEVDVTPFYDGIIATITRSQTARVTRHLITAYIPISADGSTNKIFTGTKDYFLLTQYNRLLSESVGRPIDIENVVNFSSYGWIRSILKPITIPILQALSFINQFAQNYGISIVIFTIFFYSLLFPMRWYQSRSFKKAQKNAPKMKELQDKMKELQRKGVPMDDPRMREVQMEQLRMTKDAIPIGGCLPLLLQMPLLIALYTAVTVSVEFRQESFLWLPDLSTVDPYYILPFLFAGSMFVAMLITPMTPTITPEQQMQQNMMKYLMPILMLWIGWTIPAGLLVYWIMGNVVSFIQQKFINHLNADKPTSGESDDNTKVLTKKPKLSAT
jgi:YidC/Oxa1 family membrane protein insertase